MLQRLKQILRDWLNEEDTLDCLISTRRGLELVRFVIIGSHGVSLVGTRADGKRNETRLIRAIEARSSRRFWRMWRKFNRGAKLTWEDGTPYDPSAPSA